MFLQQYKTTCVSSYNKAINHLIQSMQFLSPPKVISFTLLGRMCCLVDSGERGKKNLSASFQTCHLSRGGVSGGWLVDSYISRPRWVIPLYETHPRPSPQRPWEINLRKSWVIQGVRQTEIQGGCNEVKKKQGFYNCRQDERKDSHSQAAAE